MSENPRLWLAWMWVLMTLRCITGVAEAHTTGMVIAYLVGVVGSPVLAYLEFKGGMAERKTRTRP